MHALRIILTVADEEVGGVLRMLSGKVLSLDFQAVEQVPYNKNKPRKVAALKRPSKKGATRIGPAISATGVVRETINKLGQEPDLCLCGQKAWHEASCKFSARAFVGVRKQSHIQFETFTTETAKLSQSETTE